MDKGEYETDGEGLLPEIPEGVRAKLEAEHGPIIAIETCAGIAGFRIFKGPEYERFQDMLMDDKKRGAAMKALALACNVYPDKATFLGWLDKFPAIATTVNDPLLEFGGLNRSARKKKYGIA